jgi:PEP-CTERM motif
LKQLSRSICRNAATGLLSFHLLAIIAAFGYGSVGSAAATTQEYDFFGLCPDCGLSPGIPGGGLHEGLVELDLANYTPGDPLNASNVVRLYYRADVLNIEAFGPANSNPRYPDYFYSVSGSLQYGGPQYGTPFNANFEIQFNFPGYGLMSFETSSTGAWCGSFASSPCGSYGLGTSSSWTLVVPEPSTWAMIAVGFAGLGFVGWRSQRNSARPNANETAARKPPLRIRWPVARSGNPPPAGAALLRWPRNPLSEMVKSGPGSL